MAGQERGDFSRVTFRRRKHYSQVSLQGGRAVLDADINEEAAIRLHYLRTLAADLIGPHGGPRANLGFAIADVHLANDFAIGPGHYYANGILSESEATPVAIVKQSNGGEDVVVDGWAPDGVPFQVDQVVELYGTPSVTSPGISTSGPATLAQIKKVDQAQHTLTLTSLPPSTPSTPNLSLALAYLWLRRVTTYRTQPDYPTPTDIGAGTFCVYLDVWERHVSRVEDESLVEVALGGPDTATRAQIVSQVKLVAATDGNAVVAAEVPCWTVDRLRATFQADNRGRLKAMVKPDSPSTHPCVVSPSAGYRGAENQLYRVEIHHEGLPWVTGTQLTKVAGGAATFKWSRENGSVTFPISHLTTDNTAGTTTLTLESLGKDDRLSLHEGDWVEIQDDDSVLMNRADPLLKVKTIDRLETTVILQGVPAATLSGNLVKHPLVRRWDQVAGDAAQGGMTLSGGAAEVFEGPWFTLEDGIQIQFQSGTPSGAANRYRRGDYWMVPARTVTGDVEWPREPGSHQPAAVPPHGVHHDYAPLAIITRNAAGSVTVVRDCRFAFKPLALLAATMT